MSTILTIFAIFALAFLIKDSDGPWGIMNWIRNKLMINKYVGTFFYKLFNCYFCIGCHCGWIVYLIKEKNYQINDFFMWALAGGGISLILSAVLNHLYKDNQS